MNKNHYLNIQAVIICLVLGLIATGCEEKKEEDDFSNQQREKEKEQLYAFFERSFQEELQESPMLQTRLGIREDYGSWDDYSHLRYAADLEQAKARLKFLKDSIEIGALGEQALLNYKLYRRQLEHEIQDYDYRFYDYPVNQMYGVHTGLPAFLINMHDIDSISDARAYISRLEKIPGVFEDVIEGLKLREMNRVMPPKFVYQRAVDASQNLLRGKPFESSKEPGTILRDFKSKIAKLDLPEAEQAQLMSRVQQVLVDSVGPAYKEMIAALKDQQQRATGEDGVWKLPKGGQYYQNRLERMTTTALTAEEIHQIGLGEVARIHREMEEIMKQVGFKGTLQDFFKHLREDEKFYFEDTEAGRKRYLQEARAIIDRMRENLDSLFLTKPEAEIVVKAVEPFREKTAGKAFYEAPALDGSRPGIYYANLYDMKAMPKYQMEALAYHEGIPGHHMQIALAQEMENVPMFRKIISFPAFVEGWGLYAEKVPKEIGFYSDPYSDFGRLAMELWRAIRLVVDTGIHHKKWTREEAIDYYVQNSPNAESDAIKMVERHIVMPGQATAYKIGMNRIFELRELAQQELGEEFDIRSFHDAVLSHGALPLDILEEFVMEYIRAEGGQ